jgi:hypothetical protein
MPVSLSDVWSSREAAFENMMKIVVDVENEILAVDAELHADLENLLFENGSRQEHLWGANIYPPKGKDHPDFLEYTALINVRPSYGNKSMVVTDPIVRDRIRKIVHRLMV